MPIFPGYERDGQRNLARITAFAEMGENVPPADRRHTEL
jgi:hypothetical protein